jgi:hypothetical protein
MLKDRITVSRFLTGTSYSQNGIDLLEQRVKFYSKIYGAHDIDGTYEGSFLIFLVKTDVIVLTEKEKSLLFTTRDHECFFYHNFLKNYNRGLNEDYYSFFGKKVH